MQNNNLKLILIIHDIQGRKKYKREFNQKNCF